jgi:hypothetical protein
MQKVRFDAQTQTHLGICKSTQYDIVASTIDTQTIIKEYEENSIQTVLTHKLVDRYLGKYNVHSEFYVKDEETQTMVHQREGTC